MPPAQAKWWDSCVKRDDAPVYSTEAEARAAKKLRPALIWGDRVKILDGSLSDDVVKVRARGRTGWMRTEHLGGNPLLELYVIDVGQGDGLLLVTPEGHHIMVDGGDLRARQNGGKNAADFVDWKFFKDYASRDGQDGGVPIRLDAMIASHCDEDHFGGLLDLADLQDERNRAELDCSSVTVEAVYHAGLSWWFKQRRENKVERFLGPFSEDGAYIQLLGDRQSAEAAVARIDNPDQQTLAGKWGDFIKAACALERADGSPTPMTRLSHRSGYLPGFAPGEDSAVSIRVLGPVELTHDGRPALAKYGGGDSKNTNGHSIILRVDYGDRRLLLTGDLNTASQHQLMEAWDDRFDEEFGCDMAKGCHHGSHDVSYRFLAGLKPVSTVISSGDANTHDHPRPNIISASALSGRQLWSADGDRLVAPLIYATEIARSVNIARVTELLEYEAPSPPFMRQRPANAARRANDPGELAAFRLFLGHPSDAQDWPRLDMVRAVNGLVYGLVNVRTDGKRMLFATLGEGGSGWSVVALEGEDIELAEAPATTGPRQRT